MAGSFSRLGFEVIEKRDLGVEQMRGVLKDFEDKAGDAEWALVYFSGHGRIPDEDFYLKPRL